MLKHAYTLLFLYGEVVRHTREPIERLSTREAVGHGRERGV